MASIARHRLQVLASTALGGAAASSTCKHTVDASDDGRPWGSSYIKLGAKDASMIADRATMNRLYVEDINRLRNTVPQCPKHTSLFMQPAYTQGGNARLRILSWNINMLCGPDGSASVGSHKRIDPADVAEVIRCINPDVVCMQETIDWMPPKYKEFFEKHGLGDMDQRMRRLNAYLQEQGFGKLLRSCAPPSHGSPNLVASRVPLMHEETFSLAPELARAYGMTSRSAAYVEIGVNKQGDQTLGVYVTHLHHINQQPAEGRRAAEIESLLHHVSSRKQKTQRIATVVTGDFNQARIQDYAADEWAVIAAGLSKVQQPQVDGVHDALRKAGFVCAWDEAPPWTNLFGRSAPAFTHWTGTTVDYLYFFDEAASQELDSKDNVGCAKIIGTYVAFSDLSDHLPIVIDLAIKLPK